MILFDSLEGCDSNALILPDKKRNKKKGMDKVYTASCLIFYFYFLVLCWFYWKFTIALVQEPEMVKLDNKQKLSKSQKRKLKKLEVLARVIVASVTFLCIVNWNWLRFCLCRRKRRKHFCWQKASRPWSMSLCFPEMISSFICFLLEKLMEFLQMP